ncbi:MAG TPA: cytochrome c-type biogenesis protein CcmH [Actinobacteria bacterium]|nr:cytochrome c-type biogenesis protein CcmH [Actinomycetes bacterium]HEX21221.1 cytochrome c-type biogenesis protein CcmH [Actinomycetota bacterium]
MKAKRKVITIFLVLFLLATLTTPALAVTYKDVEGEFMCTCGCGKTMTACEDSECSVKRGLRSTVQGLVDSGKSRAEIIDVMRKNYGDTILATPIKQGFNWVAYVTPFLLVIAGGIGILFIVRGWVKEQDDDSRNDENSDESKKGDKKNDKKYSDKLNQELDDIRWY